jgi:hypothetical protein
MDENHPWFSPCGRIRYAHASKFVPDEFVEPGGLRPHGLSSPPSDRYQNARSRRAFHYLAERVGFEPTKGVNPCWFSRPVHSTALPPLLMSFTRHRVGLLRASCPSPLRGRLRCASAFKFVPDEFVEPTKGVNPCWFSRPVHSTALPPLLMSFTRHRVGLLRASCPSTFGRRPKPGRRPPRRVRIA